MKRTTIDYIGEEGPRTPWGIADQATIFAPGITFYSTPGHGGFALSPERNAVLLARFPGFRTFADEVGWYEEDCDWAAVALTFPDVFPDVNPEEAQACFDRYCAKRLPSSAAVCNRRRVQIPDAVMFDESDCSGVFDGFGVVSDADPGL